MTYAEIEIPYKDADGLIDYLYAYFCANIYMTDDGIGYYEYAGIRGYDKGQQYATMDEEATWNREDFTPEQNMIIEQYYKENPDAVHDQLYKEYETD